MWTVADGTTMSMALFPVDARNMKNQIIRIFHSKTILIVDYISVLWWMFLLTRILPYFIVIKTSRIYHVIFSFPRLSNLSPRERLRGHLSTFLVSLKIKIKIFIAWISLLRRSAGQAWEAYV